MKGRPTRGRKAKTRTKAAKSARGKSSRSKKASKTRKASKSRKTSKGAAKRKTGRKVSARAPKSASAKKGSRSSGRGRARKEILGEGNYTASREFRRQETGFVRRNRGRIPQLGEQAAKALEGDEGNELRQAEETARARSAGDED